ncbi:MAG: 50S ribosomal protein L11 methyltransferase, partial [Desulfobacterales bacterium]|nr:50S ribosomal protein L11 methyltransferase [Desulfobacterales bacterium]
PSDSIDLLFTDPSYAEQYLDLWGPLAELAARVLKPGRFLLVYCGKLYLPFVLAELSEHLEYYWLAGKYYDQGHSFFRSKRIWDQWRPILIYHKPGPTEHEWFLDMIRMGSRQEAKEFHDHGQSIEDAKYYITKLTKRGDTVLDVCCGSGGIAMAARSSGRRVIGFDVDESRTRITKARLAENNNEAAEIS